MPVAYLHQRTHALAMAEGATVPPLADYCLFRQREPGDQPPAEAGAAMLALIAARQFPGFALTFYEPLLQAGQGQPAPSPLALVAEDAILLAPRRSATGWEGFLIAEHSAADQVRPFHWPGDPAPVAWLAVAPPAGGAAAVWAEGSACLPTRESQPAPETPPAPPL
jgi:hypothetical protein